MTPAPPSASDPAWTANELAGNPHAQQDKDRRVERMFTAIARRYDLNNRLHSFGRDQAWRRAAVRAAQPRPGDEVLDVACGTGDLTELFCDAGARSVTGGDFTAAMLDVARAKAKRRRRSGDAKRASRATPIYVHADAMALPFADASFDIASIAFGIRNVSDPARALREFRRVLRPGGRFVVLEFSEPRLAPVRWMNALYCRHVMPFTAALIAGDRSGAYRYLPRSIQTFLGPDALAREMQAAGFSEIEARPLTFGVCTILRGCVPSA